MGIIIQKVTGETLENVIAKIEREHPKLRRSRLEHEFGKDAIKNIRREAVIRGSVDHRKFGDDY